MHHIRYLIGLLGHVRDAPHLGPERVRRLPDGAAQGVVLLLADGRAGPAINRHPFVFSDAHVREDLVMLVSRQQMGLVRAVLEPRAPRDHIRLKCGRVFLHLGEERHVRGSGCGFVPYVGHQNLPHHLERRHKARPDVDTSRRRGALR